MISPELLRRFTLFAGLDPAILKEIAMAAEEIEVKKGDWLFQQADEADSLYLITNGAVDLTITFEPDGVDLAHLPRLIDGELTGWSALVEPRIYKFGAMAQTNVRAIRIAAQPVLDLMEKNPEAGYMIMRRLTQIIGQRLTNLRIQFVSMLETEKAV